MVLSFCSAIARNYPDTFVPVDLYSEDFEAEDDDTIVEGERNETSKETTNSSVIMDFITPYFISSFESATGAGGGAKRDKKTRAK